MNDRSSIHEAQNEAQRAFAEAKYPTPFHRVMNGMKIGVPKELLGTYQPDSKDDKSGVPDNWPRNPLPSCVEKLKLEIDIHRGKVFTRILETHKTLSEFRDRIRIPMSEVIEWILEIPDLKLSRMHDVVYYIPQFSLHYDLWRDDFNLRHALFEQELDMI